MKPFNNIVEYSCKVLLRNIKNKLLAVYTRTRHRIIRIKKILNPLFYLTRR